MQKIIPNLWFDTEAEEAARFYTSIFKNSKILETVLYPGGGEEITGKPAGSVLTVAFEIDGLQLVALNGGPDFKFNEAVSLAHECEDQEEVDRLWGQLTADGGEESVCGWLKDKYGVSWQISPRILNEMIKDSDKARAKRVMEAMLKMKKIDIAKLQEAYDSK